MFSPYDQRYFDWKASKEAEGWVTLSVAIQPIAGTKGFCRPRVAGPLEAMVATLGQLVIPGTRYYAVTSPDNMEDMNKVSADQKHMFSSNFLLISFLHFFYYHLLSPPFFLPSQNSSSTLVTSNITMVF